MTQLSRHFSSDEFRCSHCGRLPRKGVSMRLIRALEQARSRYYPNGLVIVSGYRCPEHNAAVNGAVKSRHMTTNPLSACDIRPEMTIDEARKCGFRGIGYNRAYMVVHVDMRWIRSVFPDNAAW